MWHNENQQQQQKQKPYERKNEEQTLDTCDLLIENALGIGTLVIDSATDHSNDPSGVSQIMHSLANEEIAEVELTQHADNHCPLPIHSIGSLPNTYRIFDPITSKIAIKAMALVCGNLTSFSITGRLGSSSIHTTAVVTP